MEKIALEAQPTNLTQLYIEKLENLLKEPKGKPLSAEETIAIKARIKRVKEQGLTSININNLPHEKQNDPNFETFSGRDSPSKNNSSEKQILQRAKLIRDTKASS